LFSEAWVRRSACVGVDDAENFGADETVIDDHVSYLKQLKGFARQQARVTGTRAHKIHFSHS
jgi:hypothetical protein